MLALFECFSPTNKGIDLVRDLRDKRREGDSYQSAFEKRVRKGTQLLSGSDGATYESRFQLWSRIREWLGLSPSLPLSTGFANARAAEVASRAAKHFNQGSDGGRTGRPKDVSGIVRQQVRQAVAEALKGEGLSAE